MRVLGRKSSSNVRKVLWTLEELGIPFEREDVGGEFGGTREPGFLSLNPNGLVPVLIDGGTVLWESNTILRYLAARYGQEGFWEPNPARRALIEQWLDWQLSTLTPAVNLLSVALVAKPARVVPVDELERTKRQLGDSLRILDRELADKRFLGGDRLSLADVAVGVVIWRERTLPIVREILPELQRWYAAISSRPAFINNVPL